MEMDEELIEALSMTPIEDDHEHEPFYNYFEEGILEFSYRRDEHGPIIEVLEYDGSVWIIGEGMGHDYFITEYLQDEPEFARKTGVYRVSGITGMYIRGDRSFGEDDDEEWYWKKIERLPFETMLFHIENFFWDIRVWFKKRFKR